MFLLLFQLLLLGVCSLGWMYWLNLWTTDGSWQWRRGVLLFAAGFATQIILLENLVYLGLPVQYVFALPAVAGAAGLVRLYQQFRAGGGSFSVNIRYGAAIFLAIFVLQSASAIYEGPENYYAKGRIDHFNYASLAEFVQSKPFSTTDAEMMSEAWMVKAFQNREKRLGQSVAQAYIASVSFSSVREAYGALCAFSAALLALASFVLAQSFSLRRNYAALTALWIGISPAVTHIHLDGFLSQACVLFVFPLLLLWARLTNETPRFRIASGAILLSYLLITYTEFFVIALFLVGLLTIGFTVVWSRSQIRISTLTVLAAVVLVPAYIPRAYAFALDQYTIASSASPNLEALAADGGTLYGWTKALIELPMAPSAFERQTTATIGGLLLLLGAAGLYSRSRRHLLLLVAAFFTPTAFLLVLLSGQSLAKYPFMKICDSFTPFWILLVMRGIYVLAVALRRQLGSAAALPAYAFPSGFLLFAFFGFFAQHRAVAAHPNSLATISSPVFKQAVSYITAHPERTYIILHPDGLAAGWLALAARNSKVFLLSRTLSDLPIAAGSLPFAKMPDLSDPTLLTSLTAAGYRDLATSAGAADIEIYNPQGQDGNSAALWYWLGDSMFIDFYRWTGDKNLEYSLSFGAEVGPANPSPDRTLRLVNIDSGQQYPIRFTGQSQPIIPIVLGRGKNSFRLESVAPTEHVTRFANDARKHLTRVFSFALGAPRPVRTDDPRLLAQPASAETAPLLVVHNPQNEDRDGERVWNWLGKSMEVEILRLDQSKDNFLYELSFDALTGPANPDPKRKLRVRNLADNRSQEFDIVNAGRPAFQFSAAPGATRIAIEVLSPTEQLVKVPNDPRIHMVRASNFRVRTIRANGPATTPAAAPKKVPAKAR